MTFRAISLRNTSDLHALSTKAGQCLEVYVNIRLASNHFPGRYLTCTVDGRVGHDLSPFEYQRNAVVDRKIDRLISSTFTISVKSTVGTEDPLK